MNNEQSRGINFLIDKEFVDSIEFFVQNEER